VASVTENGWIMNIWTHLAVGLERYQKSYPIPNIIGSCRYQYPMPILISASCFVSC